MAKLPTDTEPASWHRHFAIEANNRAWELAERPQRTGAEDGEMRDCAHASAWHWGIVGNELNRMRATMLLARVHALLGHGPQAMQHATRMRDYFLAGAQTPDWELAFTHAIHAHAAHADGRAAIHRTSWEQAKEALAAIADPEDREIVRRTFDQVPAPGGADPGSQ